MKFISLPLQIHLYTTLILCVIRRLALRYHLGNLGCRVMMIGLGETWIENKMRYFRGDAESSIVAIEKRIARRLDKRMSAEITQSKHN